MSEIKGFGPKLKRLLAPVGYVHDLGGSFEVLGDEGEIHVTQYRSANFDFEAVEKLFFQLGNYFELVEPLCWYKMEYSDAVGEIPVCQVHGNNSRHDAIANPHAECITLDPWENDPRWTTRDAFLAKYVPGHKPGMLYMQA